jgi:hypothetical protein
MQALRAKRKGWRGMDKKEEFKKYEVRGEAF